MDIKEQEDIVLIQDVLIGNPQAQKTLYEKYKKIVKHFIKTKYSVIYDLDDDVSEIMIKVFLNLKEFDDTKSKFKSWVLSISKNYMIDKWRSGTLTFTALDCQVAFTTSFDSVFTVSNNCSGQYTACSNTGAVDLFDGNATFTISNSGSNNSVFATNSYTSSSNMAAFENCNSVNHISNQLSPVDYRLLDMKYVQGYEYCEIGKEFNLTSNTVSNRVNYLKTKLKKNNQDLKYE